MGKCFAIQNTWASASHNLYGRGRAESPRPPIQISGLKFGFKSISHPQNWSDKLSYRQRTQYSWRGCRTYRYGWPKVHFGPFCRHANHADLANLSTINLKTSRPREWISARQAFLAHHHIITITHFWESNKFVRQKCQIRYTTHSTSSTNK